MRRRVFISYRHVEPDREIAAAIAKSLHQSHDIFVDTEITPGSLWGTRIETALRSCDYVLVFLSAASIESPMVVEEIARAHSLNISMGKPVIVPVRLGLGPEVLLPYPLSAYVNRFQYILWQPEDSTDLLAAKLAQLLAEGVGRKVPDQTSRVSHRRIATPIAERNRTKLIRRVRHDWIDGVLNPSLVEFRDLSVSLRARQWVSEFLIERPGWTSQSTAPEISIGNVFDQHVGQLLILGAAGAGKTTLLLKLCSTGLATNRFTRFPFF